MGSLTTRTVSTVAASCGVGPAMMSLKRVVLSTVSTPFPSLYLRTGSAGSVWSGLVREVIHLANLAPFLDTCPAKYVDRSSVTAINLAAESGSPST